MESLFERIHNNEIKLKDEDGNDEDEAKEKGSKLGARSCRMPCRGLVGGPVVVPVPRVAGV